MTGTPEQAREHRPPLRLLVGRRRRRGEGGDALLGGARGVARSGGLAEPWHLGEAPGALRVEEQVRAACREVRMRGLAFVLDTFAHTSWHTSLHMYMKVCEPLIQVLVDLLWSRYCKATSL